MILFNAKNAMIWKIYKDILETTVLEVRCGIQITKNNFHTNLIGGKNKNCIPFFQKGIGSVFFYCSLYLRQ